MIRENEKNEPLVSVVMTSYNRENFIAEAIESVLASTYKNFEFIIVDDASTDKTVDIARSYAGNDDRIKIHINDTNLNQFPNRNKAAGYVKGWLMICVDSDDSIQPDAIAYIVEEFLKHPGTKFSTIYQHKDIASPKISSPKESIYNHFFRKGFLKIGPGGTVIDIDYFNSIGKFPEKYGPVGDMFYNLKAAANTDILLLPYNYLNYREHENREFNKKYTYLRNGHRYLLDAFNLAEMPLSASEKKVILQKSARENIVAFMVNLKNTREFIKTAKAFLASGIRLRHVIGI